MPCMYVLLNKSKRGLGIKTKLYYLDPKLFGLSIFFNQVNDFFFHKSCFDGNTILK